MSTVESYKFEVNGQPYTYVAHAEEEDIDASGPHNRKFFHEVYDANRERHSMDWDSYSLPTKEEVMTWVALGMPDRNTIKSTGPLHSKELNQLAASRNKTGNLGESDVGWLKKWAGIAD